MPVSPPHDVIGPLAPSVADLARAFGVLDGFDPDDTLSRQRPAGTTQAGTDPLRIAVPAGYFRDGLEPEALAALEAAAGEFEQGGARLVACDLPLAAEAQAHLNPIVYAAMPPTSIASGCARHPSASAARSTSACSRASRCRRPTTPAACAGSSVSATG
jgi:Asp-tRNA(Asn)/Glu-tRNA(Gln) amidotransferase A subunit family amidase